MDYFKDYQNKLNDNSVMYNFSTENRNKKFDSFKKALKDWMVQIFPKNSGDFVDDVVEEFTKKVFDNNGKLFVEMINGAVTENKLSEDLKDKLLSDTFDYVIEQKHDIQTITPAFTWNDNHTIKNNLNGFSFKIERWSRKWKSGLIENWGYKKYNRTDQIDSVPGDVHNFGRGQIDLLEPHTSINYNIQLTCE